MKKHLINIGKNNLIKTLSLLFAFSLFISDARAQIVYQDINPDITGMTWNQAVLGTTFTNWGGASNAFATNPYDLTNKRCMVTTGDNAAILDQGNMIAPTNNWNGDAWNIGVVADKYIGFRVGAAGAYRYGWFLISRTAAGVWTIKSYAYQDMLNTAIAAGDIGGGATNVAVTGIVVNGQGGASTITAAGGTLQMTATVTPANATNQNVTWSVQNGTGSATVSATGLLTAQTNGTVTVKATAQDGSNVSGNKAITISGQTTVGIADVNLLESKYYPNPVQHELMLQFAQQETIRNIRIFNIAGQVVYEDVQVKKGALISIPTASLSDGTYILTFENATGKQGLQKFVKQ